MSVTDLLRGDLVEITWVDIYENPVGNPDEADVARRVSIGLFWERRSNGDGVPMVVTTTTTDDNHDQAGYCCYPEGVIVGLKILKKVRRPRVKKAALPLGSE